MSLKIKKVRGMVMPAGAALLLAAGLILGSQVAQAGPITFTPSQYDNTFNTVGPTPATTTNNQTAGLFRDVIWWRINNGLPAVGSADYINQGNALISSGGTPAHAVPGPGPITALNFTGPAINNTVNGGQSYMTVYDTTPGDGTATQSLFDASVPGGLEISADVMFQPGQHNSSGGVFAAFNEGQDALALLAQNTGGNNGDVTKLSLVFSSIGAVTILTSDNLPGSTFVGGEWYRVILDFTASGGTWTADGSFFDHVTPSDPNSALAANPISTLAATGSLLNPGNALDLTNPGEVGLIAQGNNITGNGCPPPFTINCNDSVGVSITNFQIPEHHEQQIPEPASLTLFCTALVGLGVIRRRRKTM